MMRRDGNPLRGVSAAPLVRQRRFNGLEGILGAISDIATFPPAEIDLSEHKPEEHNSMRLAWVSSHRTPERQLRFAAKFGCLRLLRALLSTNAHHLTRTYALSIACEHGRKEVVFALVNDYPVDINEGIDEYNQATPLEAAVRAGHLDIVQFLLSFNGIVVNPLSSCFFYTDKTLSEIALMQLIVFRDESTQSIYIQIFKALYEKGATLPGTVSNIPLDMFMSINLLEPQRQSLLAIYEDSTVAQLERQLAGTGISDSVDALRTQQGAFTPQATTFRTASDSNPGNAETEYSNRNNNYSGSTP